MDYKLRDKVIHKYLRYIATVESIEGDILHTIAQNAWGGFTYFSWNVNEVAPYIAK